MPTELKKLSSLHLPNPFDLVNYISIFDETGSSQFSDAVPDFISTHIRQTLKHANRPSPTRTTVRVGNVTMPGWMALRMKRGKFVEAFTFPVSHQMGLTPRSIAAVIAKAFSQLREGWPCAVFWVPVFAPGNWFRNAVREHLFGQRFPYAVTADRIPKLQHFSYPPVQEQSRAIPSPPLKGERPKISDLAPKEQKILFALGSLGEARTLEIALQVNIRPKEVRDLLGQLSQAGWIHRPNDDLEETWRITEDGFRIAECGWGVPKNITFRHGPADRTADARQRWFGRRWPLLLRKAVPQCEIWASWSEVKKGADGLAWGTLHEKETLFWLEVVTEAQQADTLRQRYEKVARKLDSYQLVYAILSQRAVVQKMASAMEEVEPHTAVVLADWENADQLPPPEFGHVRRLRCEA